ncbi:MAG: hypothetical protein MUE81_20310 [Thermoflexibacter sp.]|jgi:hypothetical protein|nr:hypothetical protein [Thermoflexibacter sp.]
MEKVQIELNLMQVRILEMLLTPLASDLEAMNTIQTQYGEFGMAQWSKMYQSITEIDTRFDADDGVTYLEEEVNTKRPAYH